jgi:hypothetical protein
MVRLKADTTKGGWRERAHQAQASRREVNGTLSRHCHQRPNAASVFRWRLADALREEFAEAAEAREANLHADVGDRVLAAGQERFRELDPRGDAELMRRDAEHGFELTDEMKRRDAHLARQLFDRRRRLARVAKQISRVAQAAEAFVSQQHASISAYTGLPRLITRGRDSYMLSCVWEAT